VDVHIHNGNSVLFPPLAQTLGACKKRTEQAYKDLVSFRDATSTHNREEWRLFWHDLRLRGLPWPSYLLPILESSCRENPTNHEWEAGLAEAFKAAWQEACVLACYRADGGLVDWGGTTPAELWTITPKGQLRAPDELRYAQQPAKFCGVWRVVSPHELALAKINTPESQFHVVRCPLLLTQQQIERAAKLELRFASADSPEGWDLTRADTPRAVPLARVLT
jgi:hypothetical protein